MKSIKAHLADISVYFPREILKNDDLALLYKDWPASKIYEKTGIRERHIASSDETASDMALQAAKSLFLQGIVKPEDVDFLILCTQAPDYVLPTTACILQDRLGLSKTSGALDINLGCSGFVYGLSLARGLIESGDAKCVLLLTADTYSKYINAGDKSVRTLFGDAAAATAIVAGPGEVGSIGPFIFGTDGGGAKNLIVETGMCRVPKSPLTSMEKSDSSGNIRSRNNLYMNGADVMAFSLKEVPRAIEALLKKASEKRENINLFVLHQANKFMIDALRKKIGVSEDRMPIMIEDCGNTVSSSIPIALHKLRAKGVLKNGQKLVLVGFGVGYSWAACLVNF